MLLTVQVAQFASKLRESRVMPLHSLLGYNRLQIKQFARILLSVQYMIPEFVEPACAAFYLLRTSVPAKTDVSCSSTFLNSP